MKRLPRRASLVADTAALLRESIAEGQWTRWMPGELELTRRLRVSRTTLRAGLALLERDGTLRGGQGRRREIVAQPRALREAPAQRSIALLSPLAAHHFAANTVFWMDQLRDHLAAEGWTLEAIESAAAYRRQPARALEEIAARARPAAWVLHRSTPEMQRWFARAALPCVVAGTLHAGIALPAVDVDYRAAAQHAAGVFLAHGHCRLAILRPETLLAGDAEAEEGFQSGIARHAGATVEIACHNGTPLGLFHALDRLLARQEALTGIFVFHAGHFATALSGIHLRGRRVPRDLSLIARDDDPFLAHLLPAPARYEISAASFARKVSRLLLNLLADSSPRIRQFRIMPNFIRGETVRKV